MAEFHLKTPLSLRSSFHISRSLNHSSINPAPSHFSSFKMKQWWLSSEQEQTWMCNKHSTYLCVCTMQQLRSQTPKISCFCARQPIIIMTWFCILVVSVFSPCSAMASLKGCRSASTDEPVSAGELPRLGAIMVRRGFALLLLCGGALPHKKLMRSSLRIVLRRFFTQANMSCSPITVSSSGTCQLWSFHF